MKQAFLSVSQKEGIEFLAQGLIQHGIELLASDGTAKFLQSKDIPVTGISDFLQLRPILDGRVKTLHPTLYAGILAEHDNPVHQEDLRSLGSLPIDFVIVDLYPFIQNESVENIDIGGVSLIRAAAKNFKYCTVICDQDDYEELIAELERNNSSTSLEFRKEKAAKAFRKSSSFDNSIAEWMSSTVLASQRRSNPDQISNEDPNWIASSLCSSQRQETLSYGENPHQEAQFFHPSDTKNCISHLHGNALSYNNYLDLDAGFQLLEEFNSPAAVIIKHTNPCGVALGETALDAITKTIQADEKSAFGGILLTNQIIDAKIANYLHARFLEIIAASDFTPEALAILKAKSKRRLIQLLPQNVTNTREIRSILGGYLIQKADKIGLFENLRFPTRLKPTDEELSNLQFAFRVAKHMKSNAIVIAQHGVTLGLGMGQTSRIDAVELAFKKCTTKSLSQAVLASDGFFPFADSIEYIAQAGIKTIIQPGGSIKDSEVIVACDRLGVAMVFTGKRVFRH